MARAQILPCHGRRTQDIVLGASALCSGVPQVSSWKADSGLVRLVRRRCFFSVNNHIHCQQCRNSLVLFSWKYRPDNFWLCLLLAVPANISGKNNSAICPIKFSWCVAHMMMAHSFFQTFLDKTRELVQLDRSKVTAGRTCLALGG